ncbi:MAG: tRNA (adenosine(37)-N6)-threonylcarbamoyltransferase complex dimerization subunit type 1 TsaB [Firmicutes bacterium]|nr:tRNA (adenosine(37)-N6)-threonylcarbamoyltransferase complex dimerization subunit type 1 TsaB [Bacillota bacterium]
MKILALDTTGIVASAAIVDEEKTIAEFTVNFKQNHSVTIMPMIEDMIKILGIEKSEIDYIACSSGPGSFTGLRIGAATAKGLAHGLGKKIIPVPTLDALAYNICESDRFIVPIMDARRNQVYTAVYERNDEDIERISEYMAEDINELLEFLKSNSMRAIFLGDGVKVFKERIKEYDEEHIFAPQNMVMKSAASVGALAVKNTDKAVDCSQFEIIYLRLSQAEREYNEKNNITE